MAISRRVCSQRYPTDGRVGDVPSLRSPIYSFNICTASGQTATFTSPAPALSEERGEDAEILLPDCVSVAHLVRRQTEEPQRLHRATNGRMTTLLMNALIAGVGGGCGLGGSREEDGGGAVYGFMTVFWCCSQTDAPLLRASLYNCRDTYFQHMLAHPLRPPPPPPPPLPPFCSPMSLSVFPQRPNSIWRRPELKNEGKLTALPELSHHSHPTGQNELFLSRKLYKWAIWSVNHKCSASHCLLRYFIISARRPKKKKKATESQATVVCCKSLFNRNSSISSAIAQRNRRQQHAYKTEGKYSRRKMEHFTWRGSKWLELMKP